MTREDTKMILDKVLDMGRSPMHYIAVTFNTDTVALFCTIFIHLDAPSACKEARCVSDSMIIFEQAEDAQPVLNWLDIWAEIFRKERELDETDGR